MQKAKVLIVEDERIVAHNIQRILQRSGYDTPMIASSGEEAIEKSMAHRPDLVLMDIVLPGRIDGIEAAESIQSSQNIPILYLTAYADSQTLERAKKSKPVGYVMKPFTAKGLEASIELGLHQFREQQRQLKTQFRGLLDAVPEAITVVDCQGRFVMVNSQAEELFGYTADELLGRTVEMLVPEHLRESHAAHRTRYNAAPKFRPMAEGADLVIRRKDGVTVSVEISLSPMETPDGRLVVSAIRDITEYKRRVQTAQSLHEQAAMAVTGHRVVAEQQASVANLSTAALQCDQLWKLMDQAVDTVIQTLRVENCHLIEFIPSCAAFVVRSMAGYSAGSSEVPPSDETVESQAAYTFRLNVPVIVEDFHTEQRFPVAKVLRDLRAISGMSVVIGGIPTRFGVLCVTSAKRRPFTPDEVDYLQSVANVIASTAIHTGIRQKLIEQRNFHQSLIDQLPDVIWAKDAECRYQICNKALLCFVEARSAEEILGKTALDLFPGSLGEEFYMEDLSVISKAEIVLNRERLMMTTDGEAIWASTTKVPFRDSKGSIIGIIGVGRNIDELKKIQIELTANQRMLSSLISNLPGMIYQCHADRDRTMKFVSARCAQLTGYDPADLIHNRTKAYGQLIHPLDQDRVWEGIQAALRSKKSFELTYRIRTAQGQEKWIWDHGTPSYSPNGATLEVEGFAADVTERECAFDNVRRLSQAIDQTADHVMITDSRGIVEYVNPAFERATGYSADELIGKSPRVLKSGQHANEFYETLWQTILSGRVFSAEFVNRKKNGVLYYEEKRITPIRDFTGDITHFVSTARDITERKRIESEMAKLASFFKENPNPVLELDSEGNLTYANAAADELAAALGKSGPGELLPPDPGELAKDCLANNAKHRLKMIVANRTISWVFFPVVRSRIVHCYGADITERLNLEIQLRQLQKLETVGRLAGGIAHDFNNILVVIHGYCSSLQEIEGLRPELTKPLEQIAAATTRATNLTRQLLAFSRRQILRQEYLNLSDVIDRLLTMLKRMLGEDVILHVNHHSDLPAVYADAGMIEQIILNLVVNARDAMPTGGHLSIQTTVADVNADRAKQSSEARPGQFVSIEVTDTGCGMSEETVSHIFEPFFTTKETGKGTGLGLATVYGIVKQHQGWIEVDSKPDHGSTFRVFLPASVGAVEIRPAESPSAKPRAGHETVLVVEDDLDVRELIGAVLTRYGYRVLEADCTETAFATWHDHKEQIDLVLTDMVMPGELNGLDLAKLFKAEKSNVRVLVSSGYSETLQRAGEDPLAGVDFLPKPYSVAQLAQCVRECLDRGKS